MKRFPSLLISFSLILAALSFSTCGNDDDVSPITYIGRAGGWTISTINSDFQQQADAAIAALSDEEIAAAGRTRAEITEAYNTTIARETNIDDCDLDDGLFFVDNGEVRVFQGDVFCPEPGDPTVLAPFDADYNYRTNADATEMTIRFPGGQVQSVYNITELLDGLIELEQRRILADTLVGDVRYDISYRLIGFE